MWHRRSPEGPAVAVFRTGPRLIHKTGRFPPRPRVEAHTMFTQAPSVRLCSVLVAIGMAVGSAGCGQNQSPTRPAQLSGAEAHGAQVLASTNSADAPLGPELAAVRQATARFHDVTVAYGAGYTTEDEPCVASPMGAMGVHAPNFALLGDPALD